MNFEKELEALLNRHSQENSSNTPDFILAAYLLRCLEAWNASVTERETWYGRDHAQVTGGSGPVPVDPRADTMRHLGGQG